MDGKVGSIALANATDGIRKGDSWAFVLVERGKRSAQITKFGDTEKVLKALVRHLLDELLNAHHGDPVAACEKLDVELKKALIAWMEETNYGKAGSPSAMDEASGDNGKEDAGA